MRYRPLGDTGALVSELCLGGMTFGGSGAHWQVIGGLHQNVVTEMVQMALGAGINFIDTADVYSLGESESLIGNALVGKRHEVLVATKVQGRMGAGANRVGLSRLHIMEAVEASLTRLRTDYIDLYQIHRPDHLTDIEDTLKTLDCLVRAGKVRYIGCSNLPAWQVMKALGVSRENRLERFKCTQSYYSLVGRELERELIPLVKDQRLGLLVWSPLAGGYLSDKSAPRADQSSRRDRLEFPPVNHDRGSEVLDVMRRIARNGARTVPQVALAWLLAKDVVTSVIVGARSPEQLEENLRCTDVILTADELQLLDEVSRLEPEYPAWMDRLSSERIPTDPGRRSLPGRAGAALEGTNA